MPTAPHTDVATLRDGSQVVIRPLRRGDRPAFTRPSSAWGASRYRRFLGPMPSLTESQLRHLTDVDQRDHVALAAIDATSGSGIVGVARFIRLADADVEPALAVIDDWQARGLGTVLLAALVRAARAQGVRRFQAYVLADNVDMLRLWAGSASSGRAQLARPSMSRLTLPEPGGRASTATPRVSTLLELKSSQFMWRLQLAPSIRSTYERPTMAQTNTTQQAEAAAERIRELNERVLEFGKKAGSSSSRHTSRT